MKAHDFSRNSMRAQMSPARSTGERGAVPIWNSSASTSISPPRAGEEVGSADVDRS